MNEKDKADLLANRARGENAYDLVSVLVESDYF